jgi:peptide-N4-(N-acetyl-beta-glucosaminyl)asparagine amidase
MAEYSLQRTKYPDGVLLHIINEIRDLRRANMSRDERLHLEREDDREDKELEGYLVASVIEALNKTSLLV